MSVLNHTHQYVLMKINRFETKMYNQEPVYKCNDPKCSHWAPYSMVINKLSRCGKCGQTEFILTRQKLRHRSKISPYTAIPVADCCSKSEKAKEQRRIRTIMDEVLGHSMGNLG